MNCEYQANMWSWIIYGKLQQTKRMKYEKSLYKNVENWIQKKNKRW